MTPPPAADEPEYLKVEEVAARLKLKEKTIRDWILRGELPAYKLGKEWRIRRDDFDQAMQARRTTAEPAAAGVRILKVSKTWLYDAAKDGRIACVRLGGPDGPLRFERAVIEALIRDSRLGDHNRE